MLKALSQKEINRIAADGVRLLRAERKPPTVINLQNALALGQSIPLLYRGATYQVRALSYRNGLELQAAEISLSYWAQNPARSRDDLENQEADIIQTLATFQSLLEPVPDDNPFADASPLEVGELLRFFFMCLTMQNTRLPLGDGPSPSLTH